MLSFQFFTYKISVDPIYGFELLNHMWATEPVGTLSICITVIGTLLTLGLKFLDIAVDLLKERSRTGKLRIELSAAQNVHGQAALMVIVSNVGKEPVVVRDIGYTKRRFLLGKEFIPVTPPDSQLPHALNARDLVQVAIPDEIEELFKIVEKCQVKDTLGKIWQAPDNEIRKAKRQLKALQSNQTQTEIIQRLQADPRISTQN